MSDFIVFKNWPYELMKYHKNGNGMKQERMMLLKSEYYSRGKGVEQKARSLGMNVPQYLRFIRKHNLEFDENGYLKEIK